MEVNSEDYEEQTVSWSPEERDEYLKELLSDDRGEEPLFAESADQMSPELLDALVELRDGKEPASVLAVDAKERGNKHFKTALKTKKSMWYRQAAQEYGDGIALCMAAKADEKDKWPRELEAVLKANRSAVSLALKNFGAAKKDAREALTLDKKNTKALYRLAKACVELKQWDAVIRAGTLLRSETPESDEREVVAFKELILFAEKKIEEEQIESDKRRSQHFKFFKDLSTDLNIKFTRFTSTDILYYRDDPTKVDHSSLVTREETDILNFPLVLEYPEADVPFDMIKEASFGDRIADWLMTVFERPPYMLYGGHDCKPYKFNNCNVYVKVPKKSPPYFKDAEAYHQYTESTRGDKKIKSFQIHDESDSDDDDFLSKSIFLDVHPAARLKAILTHDNFVLDGPVRLQIRPTDSRPHQAWLKRNPQIIKVS